MATVEPQLIEAEAAGPDEILTAERVGALGALRTRPFALFWSTILLSLTGVWVRITAQGWLVYELTNDKFLLGLVSFFGAAPQLVSAPLAGAILDRMDRRRVLLIVQVVSAAAGFALAILAATGVIRVWHIMVLAVVIGAASGFDWPARLSLAPTLVPRAQLQSAVALTAAAFNFSRIVGPVVGGILIGLFGATVCFAFNAVAYIPFILALLAISVERTLPTTKERAGALRDLLGGLRYVWHQPVIRGLLSIDVIPVMFGVTYITLAPAFARDVLGLGGGGLGALLAADGAGSLIGTTAVALLSGIHHRGRIVVSGVGAFGLALILFALTHRIELSLATIFVLGLVVAVYGTFNDTLVQTKVDEAYRGRVLALYSTLWGLTPIGALEAGFVADRIGVQAALAINGVIVLAYVPFLLRFTPVKDVD